MAAEPTDVAAVAASSAELDQIVREADLGGREPAGRVGAFLAVVAAAWSIFQVWYASPLPFVVGFGIFNDTEARAIHLAFACSSRSWRFRRSRARRAVSCRSPTGYSR
jgi:TRAP-type uncharacterized transport system fused permease subunit